jgi:radical SAM protein with 4Fe4S-binding SPASM domain
MQPQSRIELNAQSFERLKQTLRMNVEAQRLEKIHHGELPQVLGIKLTNRCNLRCNHCYQWNEEGYHQDMDRTEQVLDLDLELFKNVLQETRSLKSRLYLWGGEPLFHRNIAEILELLAGDSRETIICTNGHYLDKHMQAICRISPQLELLIAVEGFESQHDALRGKGSFSKVMAQIDELRRLREEGLYKGKLSIHCVINDGMINRLYELMEFFESKGIDLVLLCFPWFISEETSCDMDGFVQEHFPSITASGAATKRHTWDAFKYRISPVNIPGLMEDLKKINGRIWKTRVRYQPGLEFDEIEDFVRGKTMTSRCATECHVLNTRVDIMPNGKVSACKFFSEFVVGDLHTESLRDIWESDAYGNIRQVFAKGLSPACSKCNVLYLQEHSIPLNI